MHSKVVNVRHMFEGILLEVKADEVVWCMGVVCHEDTRYLLLRLLLCVTYIQLLMGYMYCKVQYMEQLTASHASSMSSSPSCTIL